MKLAATLITEFNLTSTLSASKIKCFLSTLSEIGWVCKVLKCKFSTFSNERIESGFMQNVGCIYLWFICLAIISISILFPVTGSLFCTIRDFRLEGCALYLNQN